MGVSVTLKSTLHHVHINFNHCTNNSTIRLISDYWVSGDTSEMSDAICSHSPLKPPGMHPTPGC